MMNPTVTAVKQGVLLNVISKMLVSKSWEQFARSTVLFTMLTADRLY